MPSMGRRRVFKTRIIDNILVSTHSSEKSVIFTVGNFVKCSCIWRKILRDCFVKCFSKKWDGVVQTARIWCEVGLL